eukprot:8172513-Pyramimonas_sp.AAC.1
MSTRRSRPLARPPAGSRRAAVRPTAACLDVHATPPPFSLASQAVATCEMGLRRSYSKHGRRARARTSPRRAPSGNARGPPPQWD